MNREPGRVALDFVAIRSAFVATLCLILADAASAQKPKPDPWEPIRFLVGSWEGTAEGQSGKGTVRRSYEFVLADRFIEEKNVTTYPPQEANRAGEVHEHRGFLSFDRKRQSITMRQFHEESFVNLYALDKAASTPTQRVFVSESFENFDNSWKARETYEILSADEFTETFELAPPDKPFEVYSLNRFRRAAAKAN